MTYAGGMAGGNREGPQRADYLPAEFRSGPSFSEAHAAIAPVSPSAARRAPGLRANLLLWLLPAGLGLVLLLTAIAYDQQRSAAEQQLEQTAILLREAMAQAPPASGRCAALLSQRQRLAALARNAGYELALYGGEGVMLSTFSPETGRTAPEVPGDVLQRVLEQDQPKVLRAHWHGRRYLLAFLGLSPRLPHDSGCIRPVMLLGRPLGTPYDTRHLLLMALVVILCLSPSVLLPIRLARRLSLLHRRVSDPGTPIDASLLERRDELGDLGRAFARLTEAMRDNEARLSARVRELTTLHAIGRAISSVLDLEEALRKIISEVVAVFAARRGAIVLVGPDMHYYLGASVRIEATAAEAVTALGEVLARRGGRVRIDDLSKDPELAAAARHGGLSGSLLATPLDQQGHILGVLLITRSRGRQRFTDSDLQLLATVADQASTAISNARLYDEVQRSSEDLELRVKERTLDLVMANQELGRAVENLHRAQAQLLLSERLAGLGQLVAGVAHEINSPAAAIQGAADALQENVARLGERARQVAALPLDPAAQKAYLAMCDEVAPTLYSHVLLAPAQVRRLGRDYVADFVDLARGPEEADELLGACRTLAELGISGDPAGPVLQCLVQAARGVAQGKEPISPVQGLLILVGYLEQRAYLHRNAHAIRTAIGQITRIVGALKSYSHLDQARIELTDVHDGLETTLVILHSELKYGIQLTRKYGTVPAIHAYVDELNQVWTNLLHNAVQALNQRPEPSGPKEIVIETGSAEAAGEIWVAVEDNGPGIPGDVLPRIFEPFFTTKQKGEGTGIGLGIVKGIVSKHGGRIEVASRPGRTRFTVWLPVQGPAVAHG